MIHTSDTRLEVIRNADIEKYIESQSVLPPEFVSPVEQAKEYERRQEAARAVLAKHGIKAR